jgi:CRISPR-associated protein Cmr4
MYQKAYGIIETLAPLHVGASAGEEAGNLNLIFRDQFTQTGIIPGSSIRGRFRADMRLKSEQDANHWYGHEAVKAQPTDEAGRSDGGTTEAIVKFEYASLVWLPVFCPGQPIIWVTSPLLLKRYQMLTGLTSTGNNGKIEIPKPYTAAKDLACRKVQGQRKVLFFNLGFMEIEYEANLSSWVPEGIDIKSQSLVVVADNDIGMIHDMALYRQSRVKLGSEENPNQKKVDGGAFFNLEALPEGSVMVFPIAMKPTDKDKGWPPLAEESSIELYFGGLESIGFGRCNVTLKRGK